MKWSWRVGQVAGIDLHIHATFLFLLGWVGLSQYFIRHHPGDALNGLIFIGALFFIVILHELGHALAARRYGIETHDITLYPFGGVARLDHVPEKPSQEFVVALAGPAVNLLLAGFFLALLHWADALAALTNPAAVGRPFVVQLLAVNVGMGLFNLLPAFPMDGGRVLRAFLALRINYVRATRVAAGIGQGVAVVFALIGLFFMFFRVTGFPVDNRSPVFLVLIAGFVWLSAAEEAEMVKLQAELEEIPISRIMITDFRALAPADPLSVPVQLIQAGLQQDYPVVEQGQMVGMLARSDLLSALPKHGPNGLVRDVMRPKFETAAPSDPAVEVLAQLQDSDYRSLPVVLNGQVTGLVTLEKLGEFLMLQAVLRGQRPSKAAKKLAR